MLGSLLILVLAVLVPIYLHMEATKKRKYGLYPQPPEPWGIPILGTLLRVGRTSYKTLHQWKYTYGPIVRVRLGSLKCVVISDVTLIKEALNSNTFSGRPRMRFSAERSGGVEKGILFTDGTHWTEQRRFALRCLRDFGFGTKSMESRIHEEVIELISHLRVEAVGKPTKLVNAFNIAVINSLWSILVGERFQLDDPALLDAVRRLTTSVQQEKILVGLAILIPWIADYFPKLSGYDDLVEDLMPIVHFIENQINKHNASYVANQPRDVLDSFMDHVRSTKDTNSSFFESQNTVVFTFTDLFTAGVETTSSTLHWLFIYMVRFPLVQEKMFCEILKFAGKDRLPNLSHRQQMSYTEAVIHETLRLSSILPFALFHKTMEDTVFHGYWIPKDITIIPNVYSVNMDKDIWGDPSVFRPERFLDSEGKFKRNENLIPFSTGKRACLGESLARDQLFLFTAGLFQKFKVRGEGGKLPDLEPVMGTVLSPQPFEFILEERS